MSMFDDLLQKLSESNVSDAKIKEICDAAEVLAVASGYTAEAQEFVDKVLSVADAKLNDNDIKRVDKIENIGQLRSALDVYYSRPANMEKEAALADKLCDLSEKENGRDVFRALETLVQNSTILEGDDMYYKKKFAGSIASAYACSVDNTKYTERMAVDMLSSLNDLSEYISSPSAAFANCAVCLEDKKVAEMFVKVSAKALEFEDEQGIEPLLPVELIKAYKEIVKHHPEMAEACRDCVDKTVELSGKNDAMNAYFSAVDFFHSVNENSKVSEHEKVWARTRERKYNKYIDRLGKENKKYLDKVLDDNMFKDFKGRGGR